MPSSLADAVEHLTPHHVSRTAFLLTAFTLLQKVLALGQQVLIGRVAGLSAATDAFYIAQTVPLLMGALIMLSLTNTLIPLLRASDPRRAAGMLLSILALLGLASLVLLVFASSAIALLGHGLAPATAATAIRLLREMAVLVFLMGATGILNALYYRQARFLIPSVAGCLLYLGAIAGVSFESWMGVDGFALGLVLGAVAQVAILCWLAGPQGFGRPLFAWPELAGFGKSFFNILVIIAVSTVCLIVDRAFASFGRPGTVTGVTFAANLMTIPSAMVVTSLNSALLPALVHLRDDRKAFAAMFRHALAYTIFFLAPASLILFFGSQPIIRLLFRSAQFDANSVLVTSGLLTAYSVGILGTALKDVFSNALIALGREWIAMAAGVASVVVSIALKVLYLPPEDPIWIATSTSIAMWVGAIALLAASIRLVPVGWMQFARADGWRLALVNGLFAGVCWLLQPFLRSTLLIGPLTALIGAVAAYLAIAWMLRLSIADWRDRHNSGV